MPKRVVARASRPLWRERPAPARRQDARATAGETPALRLEGSNEIYSQTRQVRETFGEWFGASPPSRIVLVPGILSALQLLFARLRVERVVLSEGEYYGAPHFPSQQVVVSHVSEIVAAIRKSRADAVVLSVVTWKGEPLPCAELFAEIREWRGRRETPLLVADYCHAGAIGFPRVSTMAADVVCGGAGKWITPPLRDSKLGFLWFASARVFSQSKPAYLPFFLATDHEPPFLVSRWVDPAEMRTLAGWMAHHRLMREDLLVQYRADREFTRQLAAQFGVPCPPTNILWLRRAHLRDKRVTELEREGLAWRLPDGSTRILCRASALAGEDCEP